MSKKYTRKQLKKPDEFISASMRAWEYLRTQLKVVLAAVAAVLVVMGGIWAWTYYSDRSGLTSTESMTRGIEIQQQTILSATQTLPPAADDVPRFSTREAKLKAAEEAYSKVIARGGGLADEAYAFRAGVRFDAGRYKEAIEDYEKVLTRARDPLVRARAQENLGYCYEGLKQWDKALEQFRKLPREGDQKYLAIYQEARMLAKKGQAKEAIKLFEEVIGKGGPAIQDRASDQLALLEAK